MLHLQLILFTIRAFFIARADKTAILSSLINKTNAKEMKWIVMIILKGTAHFNLNQFILFDILYELRYPYFVDLKLGIREKSIFHEFHPDAEDLFNVTCDLKLVCEKLRNRNQRHKRQVHD